MKVNSTIRKAHKDNQRDDIASFYIYKKVQNIFSG